MLEIRDLSKQFGPVVALDGCSFTALPGRILGLLGPNGAGKTTTMRSIFGLVRLDKGEVRWNGAAMDLALRQRAGQTRPPCLLLAVEFDDQLLVDRAVNIGPGRQGRHLRAHFRAFLSDPGRSATARGRLPCAFDMGIFAS